MALPKPYRVKERYTESAKTIPDNTDRIDESTNQHRFITEYLPVNPISLIGYAKEAAEILSHHNFDTIAFRGMSGALIAPLVSVILGKPFTMVRKPGEGSHSSCTIEGCTNFKTYVIVDDFMATGKTARAIKEAIDNKLMLEVKPTCIGVLQYLRMKPGNFTLPRIPPDDDWE